MINIVDIKQIDAFNHKVATATKVIVKKYLTFDYKCKLWIAIDDTTNNFFIEEFKKIDDAIIWLNNNK